MTCPVSDLFDVRYGHSLELNALSITDSSSGIPFVSRKTGDNGISAFVEPIKGLDPAPAGDITCALGGNGVLTTHIQELPFYVGRDVAILKPKQAMNKAQILYYCLCIKSNRYRFNYGRQANKTLSSILVPKFENIPSWANKANLDLFNGADAAIEKPSNKKISTEDWVEFRYDEIFDIKKGYYNKKPPTVTQSSTTVPFVGATEKNNGITSHLNHDIVDGYSRNGKLESGIPLSKKIFPPKAITVANNGASVGFAFYQPERFTCSHDVNPLYLLEREMTPEIGLFLSAIIRLDCYRWNYGRKWRPIRMPQSIMKLPVELDGRPDWDYMETYIRTLPYSVNILEGV